MQTANFTCSYYLLNVNATIAISLGITLETIEYHEWSYVMDALFLFVRYIMAFDMVCLTFQTCFGNNCTCFWCHVITLENILGKIFCHF